MFVWPYPTVDCVKTKKVTSVHYYLFVAFFIFILQGEKEIWLNFVQGIDRLVPFLDQFSNSYTKYAAFYESIYWSESANFCR